MANISELSVLLKANTKQATQQMQGFGKSVGDTFNKMKVGIMAVGGAVAGFTAVSVKNFLEVGDMLGKMSKRTGIAVEELDRLRLVFEFSGTTLQGFEAGLRTLQRQILNAQQGSILSVRAFEQLGISLDGITKLGTVELFHAIADGLLRVEDFTTRSALASQLLGRFGTQMNSVLAGGAEEFEKVSKRAEENAYWTSESSARAEEFNDNMLELKTNLSIVGHNLANVVIPPLNLFIETLITVGKVVKEPKEELDDLGDRVLPSVRASLMNFMAGVMGLNHDMGQFANLTEKTEEPVKKLSEAFIELTQKGVDFTQEAIDELSESLETLPDLISDIDEAQDMLNEMMDKNKKVVEEQTKAVVIATESWIDYHKAIGAFQPIAGASGDRTGGSALPVHLGGAGIEGMMPSMLSAQGQDAYKSALAMMISKRPGQGAVTLADINATAQERGDFVQFGGFTNTFTNKAQIESINQENKLLGGAK